MKSHVVMGIRDSIPECHKTKEFIQFVDEQFVSYDKALASNLMKKLLSKNFDNSISACVRAHYGNEGHVSSTKVPRG